MKYRISIREIIIGLGATIACSVMAQSLIYFNTDNLTVPSNQLRSGGPPKDGIPALTRPDMIPVEMATYLQEDDRIVVVRSGDEVRAYPIPILNWHEIVNDVIDDTAVAVIYCPLCDSVSVVERLVEDEVLEFGVSGYLYESNVLMFDRTHDALWSQIGMTAISGPYAGRSLRHLPWEIVSFGALQEANPEALVMSRETGHHRDYASNPYESYFRRGSPMFPVSKTDRRLPRMEPIVGIRANNIVRAYPVEAIVDAKDGRLYDGVHNERLLLEADDSGRVRVVELPSDTQVVHTFWFTWAALHPDTEIYRPR